MIVVIDGINRSQFSWLVEETYRLRKRVFCDRLGWDVVVEDGKEQDMFDQLNPTYIVSLDKFGKVVGCMRLLQTLGPNMLADVFSDVLQGEPAPSSPDIWEATRFCVDTVRLNGKGSKTKNSISYVTSEVMVAAFEYAREAGVRDAVAVIDPIMNRVMCRSCNAPYGYLGKPTPMGKVTAMAALMDCSSERITKLRNFAGITGDVMMPEDQALEMFGDEVLGYRMEEYEIPSPINVNAYLTEMLEQATASGNADEIKATLELIAKIRAGATPNATSFVTVDEVAS